MNDANENNTNNYSNDRIDNSKTATRKSLEYKTKIIGRTPVDNNNIRHRCCCSIKIFE